jgi:hypothetical protein
VKVFAQEEQRPLSILPPAHTRPTKSDFEVSSGAVRKSFRGWLDTAVPDASKSTSPKAPANIRVPRLTVLDIMRVNHVTIREGESHCIWPTFVFHTFFLIVVVHLTPHRF